MRSKHCRKERLSYLLGLSEIKVECSAQHVHGIQRNKGEIVRPTLPLFTIQVFRKPLAVHSGLRRPWCPSSVDCGRIRQNNKMAWSLHRAIGLCCNEHAKASQGRCSLVFASVPAQGELALIFKLAFGRYQPEDIRIEGSIERFGTVVGRPRAHRWSFLLIRARSRLSLWLPGSAE